MVVRYIGSILIFLNTIQPLSAKDCGTRGSISVIQEEDLLALIQQKLQVLEETGELKKHTQILQAKTRKSVERPTPVEGITKAIESRVFYFDPSYVIPQDLRDHTGRLFAKKGTKVNPLETVSLSQDFLFVDGDNEEQVRWAHIQLEKSSFQEDSLETDSLKKKSFKLILIKGTPLALSEELEVPVYFDQGGTLTKKLGISHVPAQVKQEGYFLRVEEIPLSRTEK